MSYNIAGRAIKNEYIALGTIFGTVGLVMSQLGGSSAKKDAAPKPIAETKIQASSKEEEDFIKQFVGEREAHGDAKH